jgi:hypothetical protein
MQSRVYHPSPFRPDGCSSSIATAAITAGGGTQMKKLTEFSGRFGKAVIVGASDTVRWVLHRLRFICSTSQVLIHGKALEASQAVAVTAV